MDSKMRGRHSSWLISLPYDRMQSCTHSKPSLTAQLAFREDQAKKHWLQDRGGFGKQAMRTTPLNLPTRLPLPATSRPHEGMTRSHHQHCLSQPNKRSGRSLEKTLVEDQVEDWVATRHLTNTPGTRSNLAAPVRILCGASPKASRSPDIPSHKLSLACPPPAKPPSSSSVFILLCPRNPSSTAHWSKKVLGIYAGQRLASVVLGGKASF
jgi:hypothetical protein